MKTVLRGGEYISIDGVFYNMKSIADALYNEAKEYSDNPAFHMPGWLFSGSPYGEQLLDVIFRNNINSVDTPKHFRPEFVPTINYRIVSAKGEEPKWIDHYNSRDIYERALSNV